MQYSADIGNHPEQSPATPGFFSPLPDDETEES